MKNNLIVIDGSAVLSTHVFAALPSSILREKDIDVANQMCRNSMRMAHGRYTFSLGSFINSCLRLIENYKANYAVVVFDKSSSTTFRKQQYAWYKANRSPKPECLKDQMEILHRILPAIGIQCFWADKYEADDLGGSIIKKFHNEFDNVYFVTKDHDWLQLIEDNVKGIMLYTKEEDAVKWRNYFAAYKGVQENNPFDKSTPTCYGKQVCFDHDVCACIEGVDPERIPDKKGFAGDSSDNIPGIKGVGRKAAVAALTPFETMEDFYEALESMDEDEFKKIYKGVKGLRMPLDAFRNGKADALMCREVATIKTDIPIKYSAYKLKFSLDEAKLQEVANYYGLTEDLQYRLNGLSSDNDDEYEY